MKARVMRSTAIVAPSPPLENVTCTGEMVHTYKYESKYSQRTVRIL